MTKNAIDLRSHPPERGRQRQDVVLACGCCCCCCCCLHTVGSLIGAAVAPAFGSRPAPSRYKLLVEEYDFDDDAVVGKPAAELMSKRGPSGVAVYWWLVLAMTALAVVAGPVLAQGSRDSTVGVGIALLGLALGLPLIQLIAALGAAIVVGVAPGADKGRQLAQVGKITLGTVLGTVVGIVTMVGIGVMIAYAN